MWLPSPSSVSGSSAILWLPALRLSFLSSEWRCCQTFLSYWEDKMSYFMWPFRTRPAVCGRHRVIVNCQHQHHYYCYSSLTDEETESQDTWVLTSQGETGIQIWLTPKAKLFLLFCFNYYNCCLSRDPRKKKCLIKDKLTDGYCEWFYQPVHKWIS